MWHQSIQAERQDYGREHHQNHRQHFHVRRHVIGSAIVYLLEAETGQP